MVSENNFGHQLRLWRRANNVKQQSLALDLGVTQPAVSRWESGTDMPSPMMMNLLHKMMFPIDLGLRLDMRLVERQAAMRALFDCDRFQLLATSAGLRRAWPQLCSLIDYSFADDIINELAPLVSDRVLNQQITRGEIVLMSGVSERHLKLPVDEAIHHRWHICFRKTGARLLADVTYEPCPPNTPVGISDVMTLDSLLSD